ncbi:MAG: DUF3127 domain-containing protein [Spirosomataceae bacterium]
MYSFDVESREYNGRWYTDLKAWKIDTLMAGGSSEIAAPTATSTPRTPTEYSVRKQAKKIICRFSSFCCHKAESIYLYLLIDAFRLIYGVHLQIHPVSPAKAILIGVFAPWADKSSVKTLYFSIILPVFGNKPRYWQSIVGLFYGLSRSIHSVF